MVMTDVFSGWEECKISDLGYLLKNSINPQLDSDILFSEYSMPAYDDNQKPQKVKGSSMNSIRYSMSSPVLLFNKLNVRQRRVWLVDKCNKNSVCSTEFLPFKSEKVNLYLLREILLSDKVTAYFESISTGTSNSQKRISPDDFLQYFVTLPCQKEEQQSIADVLCDINQLISSLEKLIEKKKAIKQGAMQELLTGKKRLDGFSGEWKMKRLGELCDIYRGGSPRPIHNFITNNNDGVNWIKIGDVNVETKYIISTKEKIIENGIPMSRIVHNGDLVLSNSMSFGRPYILQIDGCIHDGWLTIQNYQEFFDKDFLYYVLGSEYIFTQYKQMASGSGVQNLNKDKVSQLQLKIPMLKEQTAIAEILSDMDSEIDKLNQKLEKYKKIKQGMMSELLTGRIRLIYKET